MMNDSDKREIHFRYIGERLRLFRIGKGLTQEQICEMTGISQSQYSLLENGNTDPKMSTFIKLFNVFDDLSSDYLFKGVKQEEEEYLYFVNLFCSSIKKFPREKFDVLKSILILIDQVAKN